MKYKYSKPQSKAEQVIAEAAKTEPQFDPNGSYTGKPTNALEQPVQDADDL